MKALIAILCLTATPALAEVPVSQPVVVTFTSIASKLSRYPIPKGELPRVVIESGDWFKAHPACANEDPCTVMGLFSFKEMNTVYLRADMPAQLRGAILVHEITHWLQAHNGVPSATTCAEAAAIEVEAYAASYRYMILADGYTGGFWMPEDTACK